VKKEKEEKTQFFVVKKVLDHNSFLLPFLQGKKMTSLQKTRKRPRSANEVPHRPDHVAHKRMRGGQTAYGPSMPKFQGERHVYLKVKGTLKPQRANYAGPGTNVEARLKRGDKPINAVDAISKAHDLRYMIATDYDAVRAADNKMISALNNLPKGADSKFNIVAAKKAMQAKLKLEDKGIAKRGAIAQHATNQTPEQIAAYKEALAPLAQQGYGSGKKKKKSGRYPKGSKEAKEHMARLRAMRGKGMSKTKKMLLAANLLMPGLPVPYPGQTEAVASAVKDKLMSGNGLALAGNGLKLAGDGKRAPVYTPKPKQILNFSSEQELVRKLLSKALIAAAAYLKADEPEGADALLGEGLKLAGNGMYGGSWFKKQWNKLKRGAKTLWRKVKADPAGTLKQAMSYAEKLGPQIVSVAKELTGNGAAAFDRAVSMEGYGTRLARDMCECCQEHCQQEGRGLIEDLVDKAEDVYSKVSNVVDLDVVEEEAKKIASEPKLLTNVDYLRDLAGRVSPEGVKRLNKFLKQYGVNASIAVPRR